MNRLDRRSVRFSFYRAVEQFDVGVEIASSGLSPPRPVDAVVAGPVSVAGVAPQRPISIRPRGRRRIGTNAEVPAVELVSS
jgi:hypothetical protein